MKGWLYCGLGWGEGACDGAGCRNTGSRGVGGGVLAHGHQPCAEAGCDATAPDMIMMLAIRHISAALRLKRLVPDAAVIASCFIVPTTAEF